jgi:hypothetical protein
VSLFRLAVPLNVNFPLVLAGGIVAVLLTLVLPDNEDESEEPIVDLESQPPLVCCIMITTQEGIPGFEGQGLNNFSDTFNSVS